MAPALPNNDEVVSCDLDGESDSDYIDGESDTDDDDDEIMTSNTSTIRRSTTGQVQTPTGFNKRKRDTARLILCFVTGFLLIGQYIIACCFSAAAVLCLKEGELLSTKNMKWMILSAISFVVSLVLLNMEKGSDIIDDEKAYTLKILLWIAAKSIQCSWGAILGLFLISAQAQVASTS